MLNGTRAYSNTRLETVLRESRDIVDRLLAANTAIQHQIDVALRLIAPSIATIRQVDATVAPLHLRYDATERVGAAALMMANPPPCR